MGATRGYIQLYDGASACLAGAAPVDQTLSIPSVSFELEGWSFSIVMFDGGPQRVQHVLN
jgi:hypothetical protein